MSTHSSLTVRIRLATIGILLTGLLDGEEMGPLYQSDYYERCGDDEEMCHMVYYELFGEKEHFDAN